MRRISITLPARRSMGTGGFTGAAQMAADGEAVSRARIVVVQNWFEELKARVPNKK